MDESGGGHYTNAWRVDIVRIITNTNDTLLHSLEGIDVRRLIYRGTWNASTPYHPLDVVQYSGSGRVALFVCVQYNFNQAPSTGKYWVGITYTALMAPLTLQVGTVNKGAGVTALSYTVAGDLVTLNFTFRTPYDGVDGAQGAQGAQGSIRTALIGNLLLNSGFVQPITPDRDTTNMDISSSDIGVINNLNNTNPSVTLNTTANFTRPTNFSGAIGQMIYNSFRSGSIGGGEGSAGEPLQPYPNFLGQRPQIASNNLSSFSPTLGITGSTAANFNFTNTVWNMVQNNVMDYVTDYFILIRQFGNANQTIPVINSVGTTTVNMETLRNTTFYSAPIIGSTWTFDTDTDPSNPDVRFGACSLLNTNDGAGGVAFVYNSAQAILGTTVNTFNDVSVGFYGNSNTPGTVTMTPNTLNGTSLNIWGVNLIRDYTGLDNLNVLTNLSNFLNSGGTSV